MSINTGVMDQEQLGKFVKGYAKETAATIYTQLNKPKAGLLSSFPVLDLPSQKIEHFGQTWSPGMINQPLDGAGDTSKWRYIHSSKDLTNSWDKQSFKLLDSAVTAQARDQMADDGARMVRDYLASCRVYKLLTELKTKRADANTHAAGVIGGGAASVWGSAGAGNAEKDISYAMTKIASSTGIPLEEGQYEFGLVYPSTVLDEFAQLNYINLVVQRLRDYLKGAWNLVSYPLTPYSDGDGNKFIDIYGKTSSDVLGTSALLFVKGGQTMRGGNYVPSDIKLYETSREHATGYISTFKQCVDYLAVPTDGQENGKTALVYEITGVSA
jgi:hypothetical protein